MLTTADYLPPDAIDQEFFAALVPEDHYLRRVKAVIDFGRCRDELVSCYNVGQGRPAVEPELLLKLEFLQFQYNLSDRAVLREARVNLAFRYFLNLSRKSPLPHHTLLTHFRNRLGLETHQRIFDNIVGQARQHGLVKDRLRLKDATHVIANIAIPSAVSLVAQTRQRLLAAVRPYAAARVAEEEERASAIHTATADLSGQERLLQRVTHLRAILTWVEVLVEELGPAASEDGRRVVLAEAVVLAHKVLADRQEPKVPDKLVSVQDQDARWGKHGQTYAGYLLDVAMDADSEIITGLNVLPANGDEGADATTLIRQEEQTHGNDVEALSIDGAGFRGSLLRQWTDSEGLNLEVFVPPKEEKATGYFTVEVFTLNEAGDTLTCPAGQTTQSRFRNQGDTGWTYRFAHSTCAACPLQEQCVAELPKERGRTVVTNDYAAEYKAARAKAQTPAYAAARRQHWRVERKLGEMVRWHRARFARYRAGSKVLVQALLTALVVNVNRMVGLLTAPATCTKSAEERPAAGLEFSALPVRAALVPTG